VRGYGAYVYIHKIAEWLTVLALILLNLQLAGKHPLIPGYLLKLLLLWETSGQKKL